MARKVEVRLGERSYPIHIGQGVFPACVEAPGQRVLLVTDSNVGRLHGERVRMRMASAGGEVALAEVPAGEASKSLEQTARLYEAAVAAGLDRRSFVVALGGGMVGDLAGFVAATFLRGVRLVQMPTSLLAMVDSAVGGKVAVNLRAGKNLVGAFYQPVEVAADLDTLKTLPKREYVSGLAEAVKYGVIWDAAFFRLLEDRAEALLARHPETLENVVARCCEIKADVVATDERESGPRAILNFGHTLAHALETAAGYEDWLHGEAVAVGMAYAVLLSVRVCGFSGSEADRVIGLLRRLGLPVSAAGRRPPPEWKVVREAMTRDKKTEGGALRLVLAERLGAVRPGGLAEEAALEETWHVCCQ